jgi:glycosyltransferase involved in cell wall biosynthesis
VSRRNDVAIYAPFAGPLYGADAQAVVAGGAEAQAAEIARALAARGFRVGHVVFDGPDLAPRSGGVDLVTQPPDVQTRHFSVLSASIARALHRADADVYIQRTAGFETGIVAAFARARRRSFVFSSSSSTDLAEHPPLFTRAARMSFEIGRRHAEAVVVQTEEQRTLARAVLVREPHLIRSFCVARPTGEVERRAFLWIGGLSDYKGPREYLALAERLPEARFWMIAAPRPGAEALAQEVEQAARGLPNVELLEARPRAALDELYAQAVAVVNTSRFEGFPNTFMEGWAQGAAALSLNVDPDGVITRWRLGAHARGSLDELVEAARRLWARRGDSATSAAARRYVAEHHDPHVVGDQWAELVRELVAARPRGAHSRRLRIRDG